MGRAKQKMLIGKEFQTGVYMIRNKVTGGVYVGSTSHNFYVRFKTHRKQLRDDKHSNVYLQHVYNKYGLENFEFLVIEEVGGTVPEVLAAEQRWLDHYLGQNEFDCYNLSSTASSNKGSKRSLGFALGAKERNSKTHIGLIAPDGTVYETIFNLREFCRQNNLNYGNVQLVLLGKRRHCLGWRAYANPLEPKRVPWRRWHFISPDGRFHEFTNLNIFCREHNLHHSAMIQVRDGKRPHHKGWRAYVPDAGEEGGATKAGQQLKMDL